jgi:hypothetical protein
MSWEAKVYIWLKFFNKKIIILLQRFKYSC